MPFPRRHPQGQYPGQREGLSRPGKKEVLCHSLPLLVYESYPYVRGYGLVNSNLSDMIASNLEADAHQIEEGRAERAAAFLKHKLKDGEVTYAELAKRLKKHGLKETEASVTNKLARGTFPATFFWPVLRPWNWTG